MGSEKAIKYEHLKSFVDDKKLLGVYTHNEFLQFANKGEILKCQM